MLPPATQDPFDLAILAAAKARGLPGEPLRRIEFVPFDPARRYSLGRYHASTGELRVVKGAPQAVAGQPSWTLESAAPQARIVT
jgi:H+-transporting ATPase